MQKLQICLKVIFKNSTSAEPKWMKFFKGYEPIKIDLQRTFKNDTDDVLISFIKNNHTQFNIDELLLSQIKCYRTRVIDSVLFESKKKIILEQIIQQETLEQILENLEKYFSIEDDLMITYFIRCVKTYFNSLNFKY